MFSRILNMLNIPTTEPQLCKRPRELISRQEYVRTYVLLLMSITVKPAGFEFTVVDCYHSSTLPPIFATTTGLRWKLDLLALCMWEKQFTKVVASLLPHLLHAPFSIVVCASVDSVIESWKRWFLLRCCRRVARNASIRRPQSFLPASVYFEKNPKRRSNGAPFSGGQQLVRRGCFCSRISCVLDGREQEASAVVAGNQARRWWEQHAERDLLLPGEPSPRSAVEAGHGIRCKGYWLFQEGARSDRNVWGRCSVIKRSSQRTWPAVDSDWSWEVAGAMGGMPLDINRRTRDILLGTSISYWAAASSTRALPRCGGGLSIVLKHGGPWTALHALPCQGTLAVCRSSDGPSRWAAVSTMPGCVDAWHSESWTNPCLWPWIPSHRTLTDTKPRTVIIRSTPEEICVFQESKIVLVYLDCLLEAKILKTIFL